MAGLLSLAFLLVRFHTAGVIRLGHVTAAGADHDRLVAADALTTSDVFLDLKAEICPRVILDAETRAQEITLDDMVHEILNAHV